MASPDLFKWRHFLPEIILLGVRWYCRYGSVAKRGTEGIIGELNFLWLEPNGISRSV
jgi:transposase-like protein